MDNKAIIKSLKAYKKKISKKIKVDKMIFFGSMVNGKPHKYSDIDLLVVSTGFIKKRYVQRPLWLYKEWDLDFPADILCYTPEEIKERKNKKWGVVQEAFKTGIEI
ncbi:nucleotidyltransferase domain-containing protein [Candidatus Woesearchaeota archaeon]|nr:nucleotidyltransferase domain-containing protein [Candidatus Woesearchaeota archaeon]